MLTTLRSLRRSRLFAALAVLVLSACAVQPLTENIAPPRFVVGDHWEYLVTDGLRRGATTRLDVQVVAINAAPGARPSIRFAMTSSSRVRSGSTARCRAVPR